jgi:phosphopantothenoylcysteine decarboxylase / phosphopantothenate---cysteine ligase
MKEFDVNILHGKRIVLGVTGSIASFKALELTRAFTNAGALVDVILTEEAQHFVTPLAFSSLSHRAVFSNMWSTLEEAAAHVKLGQAADAVLVAPASAHTLAAMVAGLADSMLLTTLLATTAPVMVAPAMNVNMWHHPATQHNVAILRARGVHVLEPEEGMLASGLIGRGRLPEPVRIEGEFRALLGRHHGRMAGRRVVVTAGGTLEPIDPVRFIGNGSSGRMGYALAEAARDEGASVTLISTPVALETPAGLERFEVRTAQQMLEAVHEAVKNADLLIMAAAVADYRPKTTSSHKLKKTTQHLTLELEPTPDILGSLVNTPIPVRIGFAAETDDLLRNALGKLERKNLDLIVANEAVSSIGQPDSAVTLLTRDGAPHPLPRQDKHLTARAILEFALERWGDRLIRDSSR